MSPYEDVWDRTGAREETRRSSLDLLPPIVAVRVPEALAPEVAERNTILLTPVESDALDETEAADRDIAEVSEPPDAYDLTRGVDGLVIDEADYPSLGPVDRYILRRAIEAEGMAQLTRRDGIAVFVRILEERVQIVGD
jgi:hypothetical protein